MEREKLSEFELRVRRSIANNLRTLLKERGMTQKQLSAMTGIPTSTLSDYLNAKSLAVPGNVQKLSIALNVHKSDIDPSFESINQPHPGYEDSEVVKLPVVGRISCGKGVISYEDIEKYEYTPRSWLNGGEYFYLRAKGDSMTGARIQDGDLLLVRRQEAVEDGEIAAVLIGDEAVLKRVYKRGDALWLQSENPKYPPIVLEDNETYNARILGKLKKIVVTI